IFEGEGEDGFRARESAALQAIAHRGVIATGGGILLREENHTWLHRGWIIYIDRPLCQIASDLRTKERPLFGAGACLQTLYAQRAALYAAHCDLRMENRSTPEDAVECAAAWIMCKQNRMENASCKM
ncbi:MAG: shikimate kinase, partial [Clostridia bacterium]